MDAVGTVVGIASLGIQVCQALLSYYDGYKTYDSDISGTYAAITDLAKTFALLKRSLEQGSLDAERVERVKESLRGCEVAILALQSKLRDLQKYDKPDSAKEKLRSALQRSWYPLRKETLKTLKANIAELLDRLQLALQVLQLDLESASYSLLTDVQGQTTAHGTSLVTITAQNQQMLDAQQASQMLQVDSNATSTKLLTGLRSQAAAQAATLAVIAAQNERMREAQSSDEFQKIIAWLSAPDPWTNHESARRRHEDQTGDWLLRSEGYQDWKLGDVDRVWISGKAGCGKTVLCSTAVRDIQEYCQQTVGTACACFYFTFSDEHKQSDSDLLRSLVTQLGWVEPGLSMLQQAYGNGTRGIPGPNELEKILQASVSGFKKVFLVMDALDECSEDDDKRRNVVACIERISRNVPNLKTLVTSRPITVIRESMEAIQSIPLHVSTTAVGADIQTYVSRQLARDRAFHKFSATMRMLIENTIVEKSDGMFRWAYCQLQELKKLKSTAPKYVRHALNTLPPTLDDTYARILLGLPEVYHQHARTLLIWLAYARSPPTLGELVEAAIVDPTDEGYVDVENRGDLQDTLDILSGLVTIDVSEALDRRVSGDTSHDSDESSLSSGSSGALHRQHDLSPKTRVRLAHFSVKEYLESKRILASDARHFYLERTAGHRFLCHSCLTYLHHYCSSSDKTSTHADLHSFPMLIYVSKSWFHHSNLQQNTDVMREVRFLQSEDARKDWLRVHQPDISYWLRPFGMEPYYAGSALYYASLLGVETVVDHLLSQGEDVNARGGFYAHVLQAAASKGHTNIVRRLLDAGADPNVQGGIDGYALLAAFRGNHPDVVLLLLRRGATIEYLTWGALDAACGGGFMKMVERLFCDGADLHNPAALDAMALLAASASGKGDIVQLLLKRGIDVNGSSLMSPLCVASRSGHAETMQFLLDHGANVNTSNDQSHGSALYYACHNGHINAVQLLLEHGADVNIEGGRYGSALCAASASDHLDVVRLLLDNNADVNSRGGVDNGTALIIASFFGHRDVVQLLLEQGADINIEYGYCGSALCAASASDHIDVVRLLLDNNADVNARDSIDENTVLKTASRRGHRDVVQLLLEHGAEVNVEHRSYGSTLYAASRSDRKDVVQLLLDAGADVNTQGGHYGSALHAASALGHTDVVQLLLDAGADIEAQAEPYGSALQTAMHYDQTEVVRLLEDLLRASHIIDDDSLPNRRTLSAADVSD